jgi:hypothetical protein
MNVSWGRNAPIAAKVLRALASQQNDRRKTMNFS